MKLKIKIYIKFVIYTCSYFDVFIKLIIYYKSENYKNAQLFFVVVNLIQHDTKSNSY